MKRLLSGNEAVARGAFEAGIRLASAYPGTPSTEISESIADAREKIEYRRNDYNTERPHRSIGRQTPAEEEDKQFDKNRIESLTCTRT